MSQCVDDAAQVHRFSIAVATLNCWSADATTTAAFCEQQFSPTYSLPPGSDDSWVVSSFVMGFSVFKLEGVIWRIFGWWPFLCFGLKLLNYLNLVISTGFLQKSDS